MSGPVTRKSSLKSAQRERGHGRGGLCTSSGQRASLEPPTSAPNGSSVTCSRPPPSPAPRSLQGLLASWARSRAIPDASKPVSAKTRAGTACQSPPVADRKRCRLHGGLSPGAPRGSRNGNYSRGDWTKEAPRSADGCDRSSETSQKRRQADEPETECRRPQAFASTASSAFVGASLQHLIAAARLPNSEISEVAVNASLAFIEGAKPRDEIASWGDPRVMERQLV